MNKQAVFELDRHSEDFIEQQLEEGNFASPTEIVRAGLQLLEERQKIDALRAAIIEGEESGPSRPFDFDAFIARKRGEHGV